MSFHRYAALRYLLGAQGREEGHRFLRFITVVAVGGVAVGVASLLLALAVVRGFSQEIRTKIVGIGAHVQVENLRYAPLGNADSIQRDLLEIETVAGVAPVVMEFALLRRSQKEIDGVSFWGADALPFYLQNRIVEGTSHLGEDDQGREGLIVGAELAQQLGVDIGDLVTLFSTRTMRIGGLSGRPRVKQFHVTGIYEMSLADFDATYVFGDVSAARDLFEYASDEVTRLDLTLTDVEQADALAMEIERMYDFPVVARTIFQVYRGLFAWVNLQEAIIPIVIGIMVLVAAFNIVGTLLMIILEKTRDIGVFASMGASRQVLRRLFLWLGLLIGSVGTAIGLGIALAFALLQQRFGIIPLPAEAYYMSTAPVALNPLDFLLVSVVSLLLCALAAYIPARFASNIEPVDIIRFS